MKELEKYTMSLLTIFNKPMTFLFSFSLLSLTTLQMAIILLFGFVIFDYLTGVLGSYYKHKEEGLIGNAWFSSEKTKKSLVKMITYFLFILLTKGVQFVFKIKTFSFKTYTDLELSLVLFAIAICVAIEFYSIFWENLPKAGMNIPSKIVSATKSFRSVFKKVKGDE